MAWTFEKTCFIGIQSGTFRSCGKSIQRQGLFCKIQLSRNLPVLCPKTGQPDFASLYISYVPDQKLVESKSLKLYLFSFRNHGDFHETCVNLIMDDLIKVADPLYIEILGRFLPRGGISIDPSVIMAVWEQNGENSPVTLMRHDINPDQFFNR